MFKSYYTKVYHGFGGKFWTLTKQYNYIPLEMASREEQNGINYFSFVIIFSEEL